jgi:hypothetical protein
MKTNREKGKLLEELLLSYLKELDPQARLTRASGASNDIGDVQNSLFYCECKNWNKENVILKMSTWNHLVNQIPINSNKIPIFVFQNNKYKKFVTLELDDFFRLIKEK